MDAVIRQLRQGDAYVVGDSVWDLLAARRAGAIGIGVMSGGYGREVRCWIPACPSSP